MPEPRPSVKWFAEQMETKLRENDKRKPGWDMQHSSLVILLGKLYEEVGELTEVVMTPVANSTDDLIRECADVANVAHMLADYVRGCPDGPRGQGK